MRLWPFNFFELVNMLKLRKFDLFDFGLAIITSSITLSPHNLINHHDKKEQKRKDREKRKTKESKKEKKRKKRNERKKQRSKEV